MLDEEGRTWTVAQNEESRHRREPSYAKELSCCDGKQREKAGPDEAVDDSKGYDGSEGADKGPHEELGARAKEEGQEETVDWTYCMISPATTF